MKKPLEPLLPVVLHLLVVCGTAGAAGAAEYVVTTTSDAGPGSLRQAILDANASGTASVISFNLGGVRTIALATALPSIDVPVTLDGRRGTSAATPGVELSGAGIAAKSASGLRINGSGIDGPRPCHQSLSSARNAHHRAGREGRLVLRRPGARRK